MGAMGRYPKRLRLIAICLAFSIGIALGSLVLLPSRDFILYAAISLLGVFLLVKRYWLGLLFLSVAILLLGYTWASQHQARLTLHEPFVYEGEAQLISLRFSNPPRQRVMLKLLEGEKAGLFVRGYVYDWVWEPGTKLAIQTTIEPTQHKSDLGYNVLGQATTLTIQKLHDPTWLFALRQRMQQRVGASLPEPYASLAIGLITGLNDNFDEEFKDDLQRTGTTHLVAVSGYNLTVVALIFQRIGRRRNAVTGFTLAVTSVICYILLSGGSMSVLRGGIVAILALVTSLFGRVSHRLALLLVSAALLSVISPLGMVYNLSWQLSFLAFSGILFIHPTLTILVKRWVGSLSETLSETLSAQIMVLPLILTKFGTLSTIAPLVNMVVLTFTPLAMTLSAIHAIIALISLPAGRLFAYVSFPVLQTIVKPISWSSHIPFAAYRLTATPLYVLLGYLIIGICFTLALRYKPKDSS